MEPAETDLHTLAGAYAMDAVADADRAAFEQHLAGCGPCREEIRGLREATARLAVATALRPRPELRTATLRAAAQIRQLPPVVRAQRPDPMETSGTAAGPAGAAGAGPGPAAIRHRGKARRTARVRLRDSLPRLALAAGGVLAVLVIVFAAMMHGTQRQLDQAQRRTHAIAAVLNAADVTMLTAKISTGGSATVVMSHRQRALVFTAEGMPALPAGRRYELWLSGPAGARTAGSLPAARAGMIGPMVIAGLAAGDSIELAVEPAAGPPRPTAPMIMRLGLGSG